MAKVKDSVTPAVEATPGVDIAAIVNAAVKAALEANNGIHKDNTQELGHAIADGIKSTSGIRSISVGERTAKGMNKSPFNPSGKKRSLKHTFYHNGCQVHERYLHDSEIEMLHKLTPGVFLDGFVTVVERKNIDGKKVVLIKHDDTPDGRLKFKNYAPNFHLFLVAMTADAKKQLEKKRADARALIADQPTEMETA